ncbi:MAG: Phosphoenolpyruvate carboxykinase [ATP], partial [uncultured Thermomicrobiales bacterium]
AHRVGRAGGGTERGPGATIRSDGRHARESRCRGPCRGGHPSRGGALDGLPCRRRHDRGAHGAVAPRHVFGAGWVNGRRRLVGRNQSARRPVPVRPPARAGRALSGRSRGVRPGSDRLRRSDPPGADAGRLGAGQGGALRAQPLHRAAPGGTDGGRGAATGRDHLARPELGRRSSSRRDTTRHGDPGRRRTGTGRDRRHGLRGRDQKGRFWVVAAVLAKPGRRHHALRGQRRRRRGNRALLRAFGNRQDHPLDRPDADPDRRRRAWMDRARELQLQGGCSAKV